MSSHQNLLSSNSPCSQPPLPPSTTSLPKFDPNSLLESLGNPHDFQLESDDEDEFGIENLSHDEGDEEYRDSASSDQGNISSDVRTHKLESQKSERNYQEPENQKRNEKLASDDESATSSQQDLVDDTDAFLARFTNQSGLSMGTTSAAMASSDTKTRQDGNMTTPFISSHSDIMDLLSEDDDDDDDGGELDEETSETESQKNIGEKTASVSSTIEKTLKTQDANDSMKETDAPSDEDEESINSHLSAESMSDLINNLLADTNKPEEDNNATDLSDDSDLENVDVDNLAEEILRRYASSSDDDEDTEENTQDAYLDTDDSKVEREEASFESKEVESSHGPNSGDTFQQHESHLRKEHTHTHREKTSTRNANTKSIRPSTSPTPKEHRPPITRTNKRKITTTSPQKKKMHPKQDTSPETPVSPRNPRYRSPTKSSSLRNLLAQRNEESSNDSPSVKKQASDSRPLSPRLQRLSQPRIRTEKKASIDRKNAIRSKVTPITRDEIDGARALSPRLQRLSQPRKSYSSESPKNTAAHRRQKVLAARDRIKANWENRTGRTPPAAEKSQSRGTPSRMKSPSSRNSPRFTPTSPRSPRVRTPRSTNSSVKSPSRSRYSDKLVTVKAALENREKQMELQRKQDRERDETKETYARLARIASSKDVSAAERKIATERMNLLEELIVRRVKDRIGDNELKESTSLISPRTSKPTRTQNVDTSTSKSRIGSPRRSRVTSPSRSRALSPRLERLASPKRRKSPSSNTPKSPRRSSSSISDIRARHAQRKQATQSRSSVSGKRTSMTSPSRKKTVLKSNVPSPRLYSPEKNRKRGSSERYKSPPTQIQKALEKARNSKSPQNRGSPVTSPRLRTAKASPRTRANKTNQSPTTNTVVSPRTRSTNRVLYSSNSSRSTSPKPRLMEYLEKQAEEKVLSKRATLRRRKLVERLSHLGIADNAESSPKRGAKSQHKDAASSEESSPGTPKSGNSPLKRTSSTLKLHLQSKEKVGTGFLSSGSRFSK